MLPIRITALQLYATPGSGSSARVRIAALLKNISIPLTFHNVDIITKQNQLPSFLDINPNGTLPTMVVDYISSSSDTAQSSEEKATSLTVSQSITILDLLEQHFPNPRLLPPPTDVVARAKIIELASLVACDIQPLGNMRIRRKIHDDFSADGDLWAKQAYERGLGVYEELLRRARATPELSSGRYSVGDEVSMADVFLLPAVQGALRTNIKLENYPLIRAVARECWKLEAFREGGLPGRKASIENK